MIRGTAAWAISKMMEKNPNEEIILFLEEALEKEEDSETIDEYTKAIHRLKENIM